MKNCRVKCDSEALETVPTHFAAPTSDSGSLPDHFIIVDSCSTSNFENADNAEETMLVRVFLLSFIHAYFDIYVYLFAFYSIPKRMEHSDSVTTQKSIEVAAILESDESESHSNEWLKISECGSETKSEHKDDVISRLMEKSER